MQFRISAMGCGKTVTRRYDIPFNQVNIPMSQIYKQCVSICSELSTILQDHNTIIFHNKEELLKDSSRPINVAFSPKNAVTFFEGMMAMARYSINPVVRNSVIMMCLSKYDILAGYHTLSSSMSNKSESFTIQKMLPFGYTFLICPEEAHDPSECVWQYDTAATLAFHGSTGNGEYKRFYIEGGFSGFIQHISGCLDEGCFIPENNRFVVPVPFLNHLYADAIIARMVEEKQLTSYDINEDLPFYSSALLLTYAAMCHEYPESQIDNVSESDFWTLMQAFMLDKRSPESWLVAKYTYITAITNLKSLLRRVCAPNSKAREFAKYYWETILAAGPSLMSKE